jgi:Spy/CpxP family protein refolding chaperone
MKKLLAIGTLVLFSLSVLNAQGQRRHKKMKGQHENVQKLQMMGKQLNLSDAQKAQSKKLNEEFRQKAEALKKDENLTIKDFKSKMEALQKDRKAKMDGLLTADQKGQIEKMKKDAMALKAIDAKAKMDKMKIIAGLNDDQVAKISKLNASQMEKMKALKENKDLSMELKHQKMKELKDQQQASMKSILTAEQMEKLQDIRKNHPQRQGQHMQGEHRSGMQRQAK